MRRRLAWIVGGVVLLVVVALAWWGYATATQFRNAATSGRANAVAAVRALDAREPDAAADLFGRARDEFTRAGALLGPEWLRTLPWLGRQLAAADDLVTIGREGSSAGAEVTQLMTAALAVPEDEDRLSVALRLAHPHLDSALTSLTTVAQRADRLSPDGLVPELARAVVSVEEALAPMQTLLERSPALHRLERHLFSGQHRFLLVAQNSSELRPTGGFMGTYGLIQFGQAGFEMEKVADVFTLPVDTLDEPLPAGAELIRSRFYFRHANWWIDFPTSAAMMMKYWENLEQPAIDGVIAVDIPLLQGLLEVFGPIKVPESRTPLTAENVMEELNDLVQYEYREDRPNRKTPIVSLVGEVLRRITGVDDTLLQPTLAALTKAANEKHIQIFLADQDAQAALVTTGWSGAIAADRDTTDLLAVSNAVVDACKSNFGVTKSLGYRVGLAADGSADTVLTLGYRKSPQLLRGVPRQGLPNYVRVHRGQGAEAVAGAGPFEAVVDATAVPTFGHFFRLAPGDSTRVVLRSTVPAALRADPGSPDTRRYRLLLVKQADLVDTRARVRISVPDGWRVTGATAVLRASGTPVDTAITATGVEVAARLAQDLVVDVALAGP